METKFKQYLAKIGLKMKPILIPPLAEEAPDVEEAPEEDVEDEEEVAGADIGELLQKARKKPYNAAWLLGDSGMVLRAHPRHPIEKLNQQAKKDGGGPRGARGVMTVTGKTVTLHCEDEPPKSFARLAKVWMADQDYVYKVKEVLPDGAEIDSDDEDAATDGGHRPERSKSDLAADLKHIVAALKPRFADMPPDHVKALKAALKGCAHSIANDDLMAAEATLEKIGHLTGVSAETAAAGMQGRAAPKSNGAGPEGDGLDGGAPIQTASTPSGSGAEPRKVSRGQTSREDGPGGDGGPEGDDGPEFGRGVPRVFKVKTTMNNLRFSIYIDEQRGRTRQHAIEENKDPENRVQPLNFEVTQEHVDAGYVVVMIVDPSLEKLDIPAIEAADDAFKGLSEEDQKAINAAADKLFWQLTGMEEGHILDPKDLGFDQLAQSWKAFRVDLLN